MYLFFIIIIGLLMVVAGLVLWACLLISKKEMPSPPMKEGMNWQGERVVMDENLSKLVNMMTEKREEELRLERERELQEYAAKKLRDKNKVPTGGIRVSGTDEDRKADVGKANIAIPFGLSETEKQILEAFYGNRELGD